VGRLLKSDRSMTAGILKERNRLVFANHPIECRNGAKFICT
jgi:hypothetical protein